MANSESVYKSLPVSDLYADLFDSYNPVSFDFEEVL